MAAHLGPAVTTPEWRDFTHFPCAPNTIHAESAQASAAFVALPSEVRVWHRVATSGVLHAKLIAADRHTALLGSANLTDRALSDNIELGVVLRDPYVVEPLVDHFHWLLASENKVMRRA